MKKFSITPQMTPRVLILTGGAIASIVVAGLVAGVAHSSSSTKLAKSDPPITKEVNPEKENQFTESPSTALPLSPLPEERVEPQQKQIQITTCNGYIAGANFRSGSSKRSPQMGVIGNGETVTLTGKKEGEYYEAIAPYWVGELYISSGTAWIHQCWVN